MLIRTIPDLKVAFGTYTEAGKTIGLSPQALYECRRRGNLPRHRYFTQKAVLEHLGYQTDPSLWGFADHPQAVA